jgi:hypothetical protein
MITIIDNQKVVLTLVPLTKAGNLAKLDDLPAWGVGNSEVLSLIVSSDGLSATALANSSGVTTVFVAADANLGPEIKEISGEIEIRVINPQSLVTIKTETITKI